MPRWLRQPRHGSRAWYCPFTLASGSDPRHESRVALLGVRPSNVRSASDSQRGCGTHGRASDAGRKRMGKTFRSWDPEQRLLLPPAVDEFVPAGHLAPFVRDLVREELDLSAIVDTYTEERGYPPYDPVMMTALLLYAYAQRLYASRRIARACEERVDFQAVTAMNRPDFRTISAFRKRHLTALQGLFVQVLRLCARAGLVRLGHVALDGTKVKANASKHKAMSYGRMKQAEVRLAAEVAGWLAQAEAADAADDAALGAGQRGDELPDWVAHKQQRLAKSQAGKAALEAEAAAADRRGDAGAASPPAAAPAP